MWNHFSETNLIKPPHRQQIISFAYELVINIDTLRIIKNHHNMTYAMFFNLK